MSEAVVYIVAKAPRRGTVKTRLSPPLAPDSAADLARAFLLDTVECAARARGVSTRIVCRDLADAAIVRDLVGREIEIVCQSGPGLGAALEECFYHGRADGFARVGVLGSDSPTLPSSLIEEGFATLDRADIGIGPSEDGGYYLLTAREPHPTLFQEMIWSHDGVLAETLARCERAGLEVGLVDSWYDVDDGQGLQRLFDELERAPEGFAPHTRGAVARCLQSSLS